MTNKQRGTRWAHATERLLSDPADRGTMGSPQKALQVLSAGIDWILRERPDQIRAVRLGTHPPIQIEIDWPSFVRCAVDEKLPLHGSPYHTFRPHPKVEVRAANPERLADARRITAATPHPSERTNA